MITVVLSVTVTISAVLVPGPVGECLQAGTEHPPVRPPGAIETSSFFKILVPEINIQTYLLTSLNKVRHSVQQSHSDDNICGVTRKLKKQQIPDFGVRLWGNYPHLRGH